jgi:dienelactone hydrolase
MKRFGPLAPLLLLAFSLAPLRADPPKLDTSRGDRMIAAYFEAETARLHNAGLKDVDSLDQWKARREIYRQQLLEMLGLDPLPERTDLEATVTGRAEHEEFVVENLHYQSRPGLYVTANLYRPKNLDAPVPAILYVCGHGGVKQNGVSYGNKVSYQHHGAWFARHGYVCLTIDSLQLGEIESIHHGTYRYKMWWWNNRGYTPAGVEAWNCVRALDYLQSRPEVDPQRIGVTGRSGGGAYSWWIAAIDERIKAAVPVAGITDLENHVVDGTVEGHCDCMFMVNTYRWDYPTVAAMVAPRPLMISNSDQDRIFPLDGVVRTYNQVRKIYELYGAGNDLGLNITPGPHKDTQELRVPAFRWFNKYLKGEDTPIAKPAEKFFQPEDLRVFHQLPPDERNTTIHETFVPKAPPPEVPTSPQAWASLRDAWRDAMAKKVFGGWPHDPGPLDVKQSFSVQREGIRLTAYDFTSQTHIRLRLFVTRPLGLDEPKQVVLHVLDDEGWTSFLAAMRASFEDELAAESLPEADKPSFDRLRQAQEAAGACFAFVTPRGVGPTAWDQSEKKQTQHRRRFMLLGQTLDGMRVWDVCRAVEAVRSIESLSQLPLVLNSRRQAAGIALYASLYAPNVERLDLDDLPPTHRDGPILLNVNRFFDLPQAVAMAAERSQVLIHAADDSPWQFPQAVAKQLGWGEDRLRIR